MDNQNEKPYSLWGYFLRSMRSKSGYRPVSFYLLVAMLVVVCLGAPLLRSVGDPSRFAFFLSLYFIFFFVVLIRAIFDFMEIARRHFRERQRVYKDTLGEDAFVSQLSHRVAEKPLE